jgi:hypothetical protein
MVLNRHHRCKEYWTFGILAGLLFMLIPCTGAWSQGKGLPAQDTHQRSTAKGLYVDVQQGRLSVDLQEADLGEVLAQIGRQAGIRMVSGPSSGKRVSARFAGVELEEGLRRLLRLASLSHIFLYAHGPAGTIAISEVRVLGEGKAEPPRQATVADRGSSAASEVPQLVPEAVEPAQEPTPDPGQGEQSEVTRRLREVFKLSKEMGRKPPDGQESSPAVGDFSR